MVVEGLVVEMREAKNHGSTVEVDAAAGFEFPCVPACEEDVSLVVPHHASPFDPHAGKEQLLRGRGEGI